MLGVGRGEFVRNGEAIRLNDGEVFTSGIQIKVGVKEGRIGGSVLAGCKNPKVSLGWQSDCGKGPLGRVIGVVGEMISGEVDCAGAGVVNFNPVGWKIVLIR